VAPVPPQDQYNRRLEKSIGAFDQTHVLKMSTVYECLSAATGNSSQNRASSIISWVGGA
jgi:hypothetical protein